jgi:Putative transposase
MTIELPDVPYSSVLLTMPPALWDLLKSNPELLDSLAAIGSGALQDWVARQYQADVPVIAVLHTFGGDLRFKPHLHILVSRTGLHKSQTHLVQG